MVGPEVIWRTTLPLATYHPAPQAAPVTLDHGGLVVTWSEVEDGISRAHAGRLDFMGGLAEDGVRTAGTADAAMVAPFGGRYIAAWLEPENDGRPQLVIAALDRDFSLVSARVVGLTVGRPIVRTTASRAYVASGSVLYEVDRDAAEIENYQTPHVIDDVSASGDQVGYTTHFVESRCCPCTSFFCHGASTLYSYSWAFTWLYRFVTGESWTTGSVNPGIDAPTAVVVNGDAYGLVYFDPSDRTVRGIFAGRKLVLSKRSPSSLDPQTQPQVASDGTRWLVVWPSTGAIEAALVNRDLTVSTFTVGAPAWRPAVAAARGAGRFLVTYEAFQGAERRLVSRVIDLSDPLRRERAVR